MQAGLHDYYCTTILLISEFLLASAFFALFVAELILEKSSDLVNYTGLTDVRRIEQDHRECAWEPV